jgi:hypothetical protein
VLIMLKSEKGIHRKAILGAAKTGIARDSIDAILRDIPVELDPYDAIKFLGAQLTRPATDPYREHVETTVRLGELEVDSPFVIPIHSDVYGIHLNDMGKGALYHAMGELAKVGLKHLVLIEEIPEEYLTQRSFKAMLDMRSATDCGSLSHFQRSQLKSADAALLRYCRSNFLPVFSETRRAIDPMAPLAALVSDVDEIQPVLGNGIDIVVMDVQGTSIEQLRKICAAKIEFAEYFKDKDIERQLVFINGPNDEGKVLKALAMGATSAHACVYDIPTLIAYSLQDLVGTNDESYSLSQISQAIFNYMQETYGELIKLTAAVGGENIYDLSDDDMRTFDPRASVATHLKMEALDKSWYQYHRDILVEALGMRGVDVQTVPEKVIHEMTYSLIPEEDR